MATYKLYEFYLINCLSLFSPSLNYKATTLYSGNIAMVFNPTNRNRNPLIIALSEDDGKTWNYNRTLHTSSNQHDEFRYGKH